MADQTIAVGEIRELRLAAQERDRLRRENGRLMTENGRLHEMVGMQRTELDALQRRCVEHGVDPVVRRPMTVEAPFTDIPNVRRSDDARD